MNDSTSNKPPTDPYNSAAEQQRLRVEAPSPASFRTKRDLVSDRVHGVARERHRAELEVEAKALPWKRHKTLIFVVVGVCVAFALHVFGLLLALDDPEIKVQPGVRAIVASIPPSNPGNVSPDETAAEEARVDGDASNAPAPESVSVTDESRVLTQLEREIEEGGIKIITANGEEITIPVGPIGASSSTSTPTSTVPVKETPSDTAIAATTEVSSTPQATPEIQPAVVLTSIPTGGETAASGADLSEVVTQASVAGSDSEPLEVETVKVSIASVEPTITVDEPVVVSETQPVDPVRQEIDSLLVKASQFLERKRLTTPAGANAYELYRRVLELDVANEDAAIGIESIYGQYLTWAMNAEKSGNANKALANYEKALRVNPGAGAITERVAQIQREAEAEKVASIAPAQPEATPVAVAPSSEAQSDAEPEVTPAEPTVTPEMRAARAKLESLGLDMNARAMVVSADQGDYKAVQLLMNAGQSPDVRHGKYGFSPLILTAIRGDTGLMDLLLSNAADVDLRSDDGRTALMAAAWNGHGDIVSQLIAQGANVTLHNTDGWTAMHYAAWKGYSGIVSLLLRNGADPEHRNSDGWNVRQTAERQGFIEVMETIDAKASG